jgi:hydrocephalus-inducing protein
VADVDVMSSRVAPGMEVSYVVRFSPEAKIDYSYDLIVVTEREKFIVPIRAVGCRALLDFPDTLNFGAVPVKHLQEKPIMVRNIGEKPTQWHVKVPANGCFGLNKREGILEVGQSEQLVFEFKPTEARNYREVMTLNYDGHEAQVALAGQGHNDNVYLSKTHLHMDPTSISLSSNQYYKIVNKSSVPVEFSWRAFATEREEFEKKTRLNLQLSQEEAEERSAIDESQTTLEDSAGEQSLNSDDSYDEDELQKKHSRTH